MIDVSRTSVLLAALAGICGAALVVLTIAFGVAVAGVAVLIAAGMLFPIRVPWGGQVPVGGAVVVATVALPSYADAAATVVVALGLGAVLHVCRGPRGDALAAIQRFAGSIAGAAIGVGTAEVLVDGTAPTLATAIAASAGVIIGDLLVDRYAPTIADRLETRAALPVHLMLACAGILVAVAVKEVGVAMAGVAGFPLLITRFSFERYAGATETLDQTVQALGLVPELAGLTPLGHSERSAIYATAMARELGFDRSATTRVITAARLHHLGALPFEAEVERPEDIAAHEIAEHGARILREAGLSGEVADLLAAAKADTLDAEVPTIEAAVVRIATTFDDLVGEDASAADRGLALVSSSARDPHSRRAVGALLELVATEEGLVVDAVAAGDRFREAAVGLDLAAVAAMPNGNGELLPFSRRA